MNIEKIYREMLDSIYEGVYFVDNDMNISLWNKGAENITGYKAKEVVSKMKCHDFLKHIDCEGAGVCGTACPLHLALSGEEGERNVYLNHKQGHRVPVMAKCIPIKKAGMVIGAIEIFGSDQEKFEMADNINRYKTMAFNDDLTGLPNRRYAEAFINTKINDFNSIRVPFGVAMIDIDGFKSFNDTYGHDCGDRVLEMAANNFKSAKRGTDLVGRWGGDEFIAVFAGIDKKTLGKVCDKLRIQVEKSTTYCAGKTLHVTASIGATIFEQDDTIESVLKRADELLYISKKYRGNRVKVG